MSLLQRITGHRLARRAADSFLLRFAHDRARQLDQLDAVAAQERTLESLITRAKHTRFGRDHRFAEIGSVADYQAMVPLRDYEAHWSEYWEAAYPRLEGATWPERYPYYALSSGTTTGATKYLPLSKDMLRSNSRAAFTTMALFRHFRPDADIFTGHIFFLGGSTDLRKQEDGSLAGDLSGIATRELWNGFRPYTFPPLELALIRDWDEKVTRLAEASVNLPITAISGIPAWLLVVFDRLKRVTGKSTVTDIWPTLKLIITGGTNFEPYADLYRREVGSDDVTHVDTYPCSEGYVATEDPRFKKLRLLPDNGIFFEFVPPDELGEDHPTRHTLREVEVGQQYAVVMTTCSGLWSYIVGDTVCFESLRPPLLRFTGRTKFFLSAFGEHLICEEVEKAIAAAAEEAGVDVVDFHVGPVFPTDPKSPGWHRYFIEFAGKTPADMRAFAKKIDAELCRLNEDYEAHRIGDLSMQLPEVKVMPHGGFGEWMKSRGKYGGQNKVPRMDNTAEITNSLAEWLSSHAG